MDAPSFHVVCVTSVYNVICPEDNVFIVVVSVGLYE